MNGVIEETRRRERLAQRVRVYLAGAQPGSSEPLPEATVRTLEDSIREMMRRLQLEVPE